MKHFNLTITYIISIFLLLLCFSMNAQVGINTINPADGSLLDVTSTDKGVFIPRVNITDLSTIDPINGVTGAAAELAAESLLVYNTNATTGPGYFYWDGTDWIAVGDGDGNDDWKIMGNAGTVAGTNYVGTSDDIDLVLKRNNVQGMRLNSSEIVINEPSNDYDLRVESNTQANMLFVNGGTNRIGIQTSTPDFVLDISNNGINIGATSMVVADNDGTNGVALSGYNDGTSNGYNAIEGGTRGNYSGIFGLGTSADAGGTYDANGVYGHANDYQGIAVLGIRATTGGGPDSGWGGLFYNDLGYTGGLFGLSDNRLKREISTLSNSIDIIKQLNPVTYFYDVDKYPNLGLNKGLEYGFIAQELEEVLPQLVKEKSLDVNATVKKGMNSYNSSQKKELFKMVDYTRMIPILTKAIQEQQIIIEEQNNRIIDLENAVKEIKKNKN